MEKDRIIKKDVSHQEVIEYFQQRLQLSRTRFVFVNSIPNSNIKMFVLKAQNQQPSCVLIDDNQEEEYSNVPSA